MERTSRGGDRVAKFSCLSFCLSELLFRPGLPFPQVHHIGVGFTCLETVLDVLKQRVQLREALKR